MRQRAELFMICQREGCEGIRQVPNRYEQREAKYCSLRCAAMVNVKNLARVDSTASGRKGGLVLGLKRRAAMLDKIKALTPMQAYRKGRVEGWHAGQRAAVKRVTQERAA